MGVKPIVVVYLYAYQAERIVASVIKNVMYGIHFDRSLFNVGFIGKADCLGYCSDKSNLFHPAASVKDTRDPVRKDV